MRGGTAEQDLKRSRRKTMEIEAVGLPPKRGRKGELPLFTVGAFRIKARGYFSTARSLLHSKGTFVGLEYRERRRRRNPYFHHENSMAAFDKSNLLVFEQSRIKNNLLKTHIDFWKGFVAKVFFDPFHDMKAVEIR